MNQVTNCTYGCKLSKAYYHNGQPWCFAHFIAKFPHKLRKDEWPEQYERPTTPQA